MKVIGILHPEDIIASLSARGKSAVLEELAEKVLERHPSLDRENLLAVLNERERLGSTGIGEGIAIPHGKLRNAEELVLVFGRSREGIDFNSLDGRPAQLFFLLIAPDEAAGLHLKMLARISRILKDPLVRRRLLEASDAEEIYNIIQEQDRHY
jgi:PTS system nitrogen regulatory IIA component